MKQKVLYLLLGLTLLTTQACHNGFSTSVRGNGNETSDTRAMPAFHEVSARGFMNVYLIQGSESEVKLEGESNILPYIETKVEDGRLIIRTKDDVSISTSRTLSVYVTSPTYDVIRLAGSGDVIGQTKITNENSLKFELAGSGNVRTEVDAPAVKIDLAGSGKLQLKGETRKLNVSIAGSGNYESDALKSEDADISIAGSGSAYVYASVSLKVSIAGSGDVYYHGSPTIDSHVAGSGSVKQRQ